MLLYFLNFSCTNIWSSLCSKKISTVCSTPHLFLTILFCFFFLFVHIFRFIYYIKFGIITILCFFVPKLKSVLKWSSHFLHCFVIIMVFFDNSPPISHLLLVIILNLWQENILVLQALGWMVLKCLYVGLQLTLSPQR